MQTSTRLTLLPLALFGLTSSSAAQAPSGLTTTGVAHLALPSVDGQARGAEDVAREARGLPPRFAIPFPVQVSPRTDGSWENLDADTLLWRLRISSAGALSMNLGFTRFHLPATASLVVQRTHQPEHYQAYTSADNEAHGELWTPVVLGDDVLVELTVPFADLDRVLLELTAVNAGYRYFGEKQAGLYFAGSCNVDVVCPEGVPWESEINSVGVISTGGSTFCTGYMVNNTAQNAAPYFMTANHCGVSSGNAASLVVYWNYQSPTCGQQGGGSLGTSQTGSYWRASYSTSDFTLVELDSAPNPAWLVTFAGWDKSGTNPGGAIAIHHPSTDEKSISFEYQPTTTTTYLGTSQPGDGTHVRVEDWDVGTTEPGSSGSPLFDPNHRVIGQLHGGYAACGNNLADWYGRFSRSWTGGGSNATRLSNWLDPISSGASALDTYDPYATGLRVLPGSAFESQGDPGGPFAPNSLAYTLENRGNASFNYQVTAGQNWVGLTNAAGSIAPGATQVVTVSINSLANLLTVGVHEDTLSFLNLTTGEGDTTRSVRLQVGTPSLIYDFPLDTSPGWTTQGAWAFGQPTGGGGEHGNPDPTSGHTGTKVYGYNLNGDYTNNMGQMHLTSGALDCSSLSATTLKFWRWLNVEVNTYDHAYLRVSSDGVNWTTVWENGAEVIDSSWQQVSYDISAVADGQSAVRLRWTQGTTDSSWLYSGWNIDDIEIWGLPTNTPPTTYCTGKVSSNFCLPSMGFSGTPSASAPNGFDLNVSNVENGKFGIFFYGTTGADSAPFLGGTLCLQAPFQRTTPQNSGANGLPACSGTLTIDLNATGICNSIGSGTQAWIQAWFRDPPSSFGVGLSDALTFTVQP
jgi:hypothetical protein